MGRRRGMGNGKRRGTGKRNTKGNVRVKTKKKRKRKGNGKRNGNGMGRGMGEEMEEVALNKMREVDLERGATPRRSASRVSPRRLEAAVAERAAAAEGLRAI